MADSKWQTNNAIFNGIHFRLKMADPRYETNNAIHFSLENWLISMSSVKKVFRNLKMENDDSKIYEPIYFSLDVWRVIQFMLLIESTSTFKMLFDFYILKRRILYYIKTILKQPFINKKGLNVSWAMLSLWSLGINSSSIFTNTSFSVLNIRLQE